MNIRFNIREGRTDINDVPFSSFNIKNIKVKLKKQDICMSNENYAPREKRHKNVTLAKP